MLSAKGMGQEVWGRRCVSRSAGGLLVHERARVGGGRAAEVSGGQQELQSVGSGEAWKALSVSMSHDERPA